jgi:hypothetical protein
MVYDLLKRLITETKPDSFSSIESEKRLIRNQQIVHWIVLFALLLQGDQLHRPGGEASKLFTNYKL